MNITKNQLIGALGVAALAVTAIFLYNKYSNKEIAKSKPKNSGDSPASSTSDGLVQTEMGRAAASSFTAFDRGAFPSAAAAKKSFCQEHPQNYNCRVKQSGGVLLAK